MTCPFQRIRGIERIPPQLQKTCFRSCDSKAAALALEHVVHNRSTQVLCSNRPTSSRLRLCKPFSLTEARPKSSENGSHLKTLKITFSRVTLEEKSAFQNYVGISHFQDEHPESSNPCFGRFSGLHDFFYSRVTLETT